MSTQTDKLTTLATHFGLTVEALLAAASQEDRVPAICTNPNCDWFTEYEPDADCGWCEACDTGSVQSALVLAGVLLGGSTPTPRTVSLPLFSPGWLVLTPAALEALNLANQDPRLFVQRHILGDWGVISSAGRERNEIALAEGTRVVSIFPTRTGTELWVLTDGKRSSTCILTRHDFEEER